LKESTETVKIETPDNNFSAHNMEIPLPPTDKVSDHNLLNGGWRNSG